MFMKLNRWHYSNRFFVKLNKTADPGKYSCSWYGIGFDSLPNFDWDKNAFILVIGNSSSLHIDHKKQGPT